ncbi:MAG: hypothetical protein FWC21_07070 [Treponema sp.]|nr:hypothetical protein [Treponema sp.]
MKLFQLTGSKASRVVYIALLSITCLLIFLLLIGTIIGLIRQGNEPLIILGNTNPTEQTGGLNQRVSGGSSLSDDIRIYTEIGRLRVPLANSSILILSIVFPYSASDIAFTEELAARVIDFRILATDYFQSLPPQALIQIDEDTAKKELLRMFNSALRLGSVETIYFEDLLMIDSSF